MRKCIVMSDLHLVAQGDLCNGIDTCARLEKAVRHINSRHADAEICILAGDLADGGQREAYEFLRQQMPLFAVPVVFTMGNHDNRVVAAATLGAQPNPATRRFDHAVRIGDHLWIVLDTLIDGHVEGGLTTDQLGWLTDQLSAHGSGPVVVVTHHNPALLGVPTDPIGLSGVGPLFDLLTRHGQVQQIISGHVHCATSALFRGLPMTTIAGNHYNMLPQYGGTLDDVIRAEGPAQIGVILTGPDGVVVHHESFVDANAAQSPDLHRWPPEEA